jgi:hypothetical protein
MQREYKDTTTYFQIYFRLASKDDCMNMGMHDCTKDNATSGTPTSFNTDMPSNGTENAGLDNDVGTLWWL